MKTDAYLFCCYDYGSAIGRPASEVMKLPVREVLGYYAYLKIKTESVS